MPTIYDPHNAIDISKHNIISIERRIIITLQRYNNRNSNAYILSHLIMMEILIGIWAKFIKIYSILERYMTQNQKQVTESWDSIWNKKIVKIISCKITQIALTQIKIVAIAKKMRRIWEINPYHQDNYRMFYKIIIDNFQTIRNHLPFPKKKQSMRY